jgi:hypothetical protein
MSPHIETKEDAEVLRKFEKLRELIFARRPILQEIIHKHGHKSLYEYGQDYLDVNLNSTILERQQEFISVFYEEVKKILGADIAQSAAEQLKKYYFVSTADHHGPICHPFFLNSNLIIASSYQGHDDPLLKHVIVLSCANISLNNSSFPRGLLFNGAIDEKIQMQRLSFLPSNAHSSTVYNFRPFTESDITKVYRVIEDKRRTSQVTNAVADMLRDTVRDIYATDDILQRKDFSEQVTVTNYRLWNSLFGKSDLPHPSLIYLEQENLVTQLFLRYHLFADTAVHRVLFQPEYESLVYKYFENIMGAFSRKEKWGTYFFWGVDEGKNYRIHLWRHGDKLVSDDGAFTIPLTPEAIRDALLQKRIIPSMLLIFLILSFYYGLKCLGGVNQVNYLTLMKQAFIDMQTETGDMVSVEACRDVQTKEFVDGPTIAFLSGLRKEIVPAASLDFLLYGNEHSWEHIINLSKSITLDEAFSPLLPEYYPIMYADSERLPELSSVTSDRLTSLTCLDKKIQACVQLI